MIINDVNINCLKCDDHYTDDGGIYCGSLYPCFKYKNRPLKIGIDLDCVLNNLVDIWIKILNEKHGLNIQYNDVKQWDMQYTYPTLSHDQVYEPLYMSELWNQLSIQPYSKISLRQLMNSGHQIYIVTNTHYTNTEVKMRWLFKQFPFIKWNQIIITSNKQLLKLDILIDDYEKNLIGGDYIRILFDCPWNRDVDDKKYELIRTFGWKNTNKTINIIAGKRG